MKTIVSDQHIPEAEIKPLAESGEYRRLLEIEYRALLARHGAAEASACPGCGSRASIAAFEKSAQPYVECADCASVYASPRPARSALESFYQGSAAWRYWREQLLPATREARREKIFRPRAQWVLDTLDRHQPEARAALCIGQHSDLLIEELLATRALDFTITVTDALAAEEFSSAPSAGLQLAPTADRDLPARGPVDFIMAFDALERAADVPALIASCHAALRPQGLLLATSTLISGFDLQVLWDQSTSIQPPERLNLLSARGVLALAARHDFEVLEFSTPGVFDSEIVRHAVAAQPAAPWPRFLRSLVASDPETLDGFQEYLQKFRLSSHARLVFRKR